MTRSISWMLAVVLLMIGGTSAHAQSSTASTPSHPTSLGFLGGFAGGSVDTGGSVGGTLSFDVTDGIGLKAAAFSCGADAAPRGSS